MNSMIFPKQKFGFFTHFKNFKQLKCPYGRFHTSGEFHLLLLVPFPKSFNVPYRGGSGDGTGTGARTNGAERCAESEQKFRTESSHSPGP